MRRASPVGAMRNSSQGSIRPRASGEETAIDVVEPALELFAERVDLPRILAFQYGAELVDRLAHGPAVVAQTLFIEAFGPRHHRLVRGLIARVRLQMPEPGEPLGDLLRAQDPRMALDHQTVGRPRADDTGFDLQQATDIISKTDIDRLRPGGSAWDRNRRLAKGDVVSYLPCLALEHSDLQSRPIVAGADHPGLSAGRDDGVAFDDREIEPGIDHPAVFGPRHFDAHAEGSDIGHHDIFQ